MIEFKSNLKLAIEEHMAGLNGNEFQWFIILRTAEQRNLLVELDYGVSDSEWFNWLGLLEVLGVMTSSGK